jgi:hypothetical protein
VTSGLVAVVLGSLLRWPLPLVARVAIAGGAAVVVIAGELGLITLRLPQNARQVPEWIIDEGSRVGPAQFGFELGTGVRTFMTSGVPYLLAGAILLLADWRAALLAGAGFGAGRSWMALARLWYGDPARWDRTLARLMRPLRATLGCAAVVALATVVAQLLGGSG